MIKTVFLTGATGNMGWAGFRELYARRDEFNIRILARKSTKNIKKLSPYMDDPSVTIIWGDLTVYEDVFKGVEGSDYVLHVGGMVSPAADYYPQKTLKVNVLSAENVAKAVLAQPNADEIKVVYIGSVAQYGDRRLPFHWGRTGDPVLASRYDMYSVSKCKAEKAIVDSGIRHWVSIRQTGILYPGILSVVNPTAFHVPVSGVLEWATIEDSGRLLANICGDDVPDEFWNRFYNLSSGEQYRMTNYEFEKRMLSALGLPGPEKIFEPQWFATRNFHGMWYTDADVLDSYLHFRANIPVDEYFRNMKKSLPWFYSLAFLAPAFAVKMFMKPYAFEKGLGTQTWLRDDPDKLEAYYGSKQEYESIRSWDDVRPPYLEKNLQNRSDCLSMDGMKASLWTLSQMKNLRQRRLFAEGISSAASKEVCVSGSARKDTFSWLRWNMSFLAEDGALTAISTNGLSRRDLPTGLSASSSTNLFVCGLQF